MKCKHGYSIYSICIFMRCVHVYNKLHRQRKARIWTAIITNKNEAIAGNCNGQEAMRKVWTAYLHHREISAQDDWKNLRNVSKLYYNILLLPKIFEDLKSTEQFKQANIVCITE